MTVSADSAGPFNDPGTVITASSGDDGYLNWYANKSHTLGYANYPAASPDVVAVGGTRLRLTESGGWKEEAVWNGYGASGGGCSSIFTAPAWQQSVAGWSSVGCGTYRAVADVSADADPYTGVAVYDSTPVEEEGTEYSGWVTMGGTSVASPIIASTFALAGGAGKDEAGQTVDIRRGPCTKTSRRTRPTCTTSRRGPTGCARRASMKPLARLIVRRPKRDSRARALRSA